MLKSLLLVLLSLLVLYCVFAGAFQSNVGRYSGFSWSIVVLEVSAKVTFWLAPLTRLLDFLFCLWLLIFGYRKPEWYAEGSSTPWTLLYVIVMLGIWAAGGPE